MLVLPVDQNSAWFEFSSELDGVSLTFTFRWNDRSERWFIDLADSQGNAVASSIAVVSPRDLFGCLHSLTGVPPGCLFAFDTTGNNADPTFDSLGRRHLIVYASPDELQSVV